MQKYIIYGLTVLLTASLVFNVIQGIQKGKLKDLNTRIKKEIMQDAVRTLRQEQETQQRITSIDNLINERLNNERQKIRNTNNVITNYNDIISRMQKRPRY